MTLSPLTIVIALLFVVWCVVAVAICIGGWRSRRADKPVDPDWDGAGEP